MQKKYLVGCICVPGKFVQGVLIFWDSYLSSFILQHQKLFFSYNTFFFIFVAADHVWSFMPSCDNMRAATVSRELPFLTGTVYSCTETTKIGTCYSSSVLRDTFLQLLDDCYELFIW